MTDHLDAIADAWLLAASDLGIRVTVPPPIGELDAKRAHFIALVHDFGGRSGMLIASLEEDSEQLNEIAARHGLTVSLLNSALYSRYDRDYFVDTLNDWKWSGVGSAPAWYTGKSSWET